MNLPLLLYIMFATFAPSLGGEVAFDSRALLIDGKRQLLISGSLHYPRSTPAMWPGLLSSLKGFGANIVEMYDFWTCHESVRGQYNFEGRCDVVRFIKEAQKAGLWVLLRIGPYVNAEWNYGGLPAWLKFVGGITFRTYNAPYLAEMKRWVTRLVDLLKENKLFYSQGGPIVAAQIENEYQNQEHEYGEDGKRYVQWCASFARNLSIGVPWIMCYQDDAPADIINTCNGFYCDWWISQHKQRFPNQPSWFTENWMGWYQRWGDPRPLRPAEDIAFSVLRWFARGGTLMNYYMFYGGNSYERLVGGPGFATNYAFDAMLDEFGQKNQPKFSHLRRLNEILTLHSATILASEPIFSQLEPNVEAHVYGVLGTRDCLAFLSNVDSAQNKTVVYNSRTYYLPAWSVSILEGCSEQVYNSALVQAPSQQYIMREINMGPAKAGWLDEPIARAGPAEYFRSPREQLSATRDSTDYLWYSTIYTNKDEATKKCELRFENVKDLAHVFVNKKLVGSTTGNVSVEVPKGRTELDVLSMTLGLINYGSFFEKYKRGIVGKVWLCGTDITEATWKHVSGVAGEVKKYYDPDVAKTLPWNTDLTSAKHRPLTWFMRKLTLSPGSLPLALDMVTMGKGYAWINGHNVGRYYLTLAKGNCAPCDYRRLYYAGKCQVGCGQFSQRFYNVPLDWVLQGENTLVVFEETGGDIEGVKVVERHPQEFEGAETAE